VPLSRQAGLILSAFGVLFLAGARVGAGQQAKPAAMKQEPQAPGSAIAKKPTVGPAAPQSTHYPILLLVQGATEAGIPQPNPAESGTTIPPTVTSVARSADWSVRIGLKGPERMDRVGYPPIPLEPAEVVREGSSDTWTYHAKDSQTGAAVTVHLTREPCMDVVSGTKFTFTAAVEHAQVGAMQGCARVATELFPKINNQPTEEDEEAKDKPAPPTITKFKPPVAVAYITATGKMVVKRGTLLRSVPGKAGYSLCLSHDGKKLLFTRDEQSTPMLRTINEYNLETGKTRELVRANAYQAFWSSDDTRIAFQKIGDAGWQVWTMPADAPEKAAAIYAGEVASLHGWADEHTIIVEDFHGVNWIGDDGTAKQTLSSMDLYGKDEFGPPSAIRISPINPDLLLVSAEWVKPPQGVAIDPHKGRGMGFFLYEIRSKRRVILCPLNLFSGYAEWSRDSLQIFFTGWETPDGPATIYKMFWDGTSQTKYQDGSSLVMGQ